MLLCLKMILLLKYILMKEIKLLEELSLYIIVDLFKRKMNIRNICEKLKYVELLIK